MDYFMNLLVRAVVFLSRFTSFLSKMRFLDYLSFEGPENDPKLKILLVGYNGARNTGADVRTAEIVKQLQKRLGKDQAEISVMTLDEETIRCYFTDKIRLIPFRSIFFRDVFRACCSHQAVILCEGSTLKSKFANALTLYFCEAAGIMKNQHKPCIAYGSEAGRMDPFLERTVRRLCSDTYFIARTRNSLDHIHTLGLQGHLGTDTAWKFDSTSYIPWADAQLTESGWDGDLPLLGIAPINPFWWPVKPSLIKWLKTKITGDHSLQFQLWYFFSSSKQRKQQFEKYLDAITLSVHKFTAEHPCHVVLFGMERLDQDACSRLTEKLAMPVSVFLSVNYDGFQMAAGLRKLSWLITSRYHAAVLSMKSRVPCIAVSMDERLDNLMQEMDMDQSQLLHADDTDLSLKLISALEFVQSHSDLIQEKTGYQLMHFQNSLDAMGDFLVQWLFSHKRTV